MMNTNISDELKIYELSLIWKEAAQNFAFWERMSAELDWDKAYREALPRVLATDNLYDYYMELSRFLALLKDGHTRLFDFPESLYDSFTSLPVDIGYRSGHHVILDVDKSLENEIKQYSVVRKFNGVDIFEYIEKNLFPYHWHEKYDTACDYLDFMLRRGITEDEVTLELEYDGEVKTVSVKRWNLSIEKNWVYGDAAPKPSEAFDEVYSSDSHSIKMTNDNIAVITIEGFDNDSLREEFYANFPILQKARGYIIDIRRNGGGGSMNADAVSAAFIKGLFYSGRSLLPIYIGNYKTIAPYLDFGDDTYEKVAEKYGTYDWRTTAYKVWKNMHYHDTLDERYSDFYEPPSTLTAPLVLLVSELTGSAAEDMVVAMAHSKRAVIVGKPTAGSNGQPRGIKLESGGRAWICTQYCKLLDGGEYINIGVTPDVYFDPSLDDWRGGIDSGMNKGLEEIRKLV
jgi:Periplasmic protease